MIPRRNARLRDRIEPLEPRIAPAVVFDARTLIFNDFDGDLAIVKFSKDVFTGDYATQLATANAVFKFDAGNVAPDETTSQQLRLIDLTKLPTNPLTGSIAKGLSLTITTQQRAGNGTTDVGAIKANGISLGTVTLNGDLGQIDAGSIFSRVGLAGLSVNSLGARGTTTQIPVPTPTTENPAPDLVSTITGELTALKVFGDVTDARLSVVHGRDAQNNLTTLGNLGSIRIGGSLRGRADLAVASDNTGFIEADGNIGAVKIGTALADGIFGGGGKSSGRIRAGGSIGSVSMSGGIDGGAGFESGMISASGIGPVNLGSSLEGGAGESSGVIRSFGNLGAVKIAGNISAGTGAGSGVIFSRGVMSAVLVTGNIDGSTTAAGAGSAGILAQAGLAGVKVLGNVIGGAQAQTGFIRSGFDPLQAGGLGSVTIAGFMVGGGGDDSGAIVSGGAIGSITVGNAGTKQLDVVTGGAGEFSGAISAIGKISSLKIMGAVRGGGGDFSGALIAFERTGTAEEITGDLGNISIAGALAGGTGAHSGAILSDGRLAALTVGAIDGGTGAGSASIQTGRGLLGTGNSGAIKIIGSFAQASAGIPGAGSATIDIGGSFAALSVSGATTGATVHAGDAIGALKFGGDVTNVTVTARGQAAQGAKSDIAIASIAVRGSVTGSSFLAGYDAAGVAVNPDAQIGAVTVGGNWTASNLVAGIAAGADAGFGNAQDIVAPGFDNTAIISRIASVIIGGTVSGTAAGLDHFGFVAQTISKFKASGLASPLNDATTGQFVELDDTNDDVTLREIA